MIILTAGQPIAEFRMMHSVRPDGSFSQLAGRGIFYLEFMISSPVVSTDSLEAGKVSRLSVLNRHFCAAWGGKKGASCKEQL